MHKRGSMARFILEGVSYYQQGRKCGNPSCRCAQGGENLHGPYWYGRDLTTGKVRYLGRQLTEHIEKARDRHAYYASARLNWMRRERTEHAEKLLAEARTLEKLANGEPLTHDERAWLREQDLGDALVSEPSDLPPTVYKTDPADPNNPAHYAQVALV